MSERLRFIHLMSTSLRSLVGSLLSHLSLQLEHLLQDAPFTPREEAAVLTMGMVSTLNLLALGDDCNDYWLTRTRYCTMALELVDWMYRERGVSDRLLHSLYEWTSMATWLFSLHGFVKFLDFSEVVAVVVRNKVICRKSCLHFLAFRLVSVCG